jgi:hypothetical protein
MLRAATLAGLLLSACTTPAANCPAVESRPPTAPVTSARSEIVSKVEVGNLSYVFRVSPFSNLVYQLDCLAGTINCSAEAFREVWQKELGGLSADDSARLVEWKKLRREYGGRIQKESPELDPGVPLPRSRRQIESRIRIAGHMADDEESYAEHLRILIDDADVSSALAIVRHFRARFDRYWQKNESRARAAGEGFAKALKTPSLIQLAGQIFAFYRAELPKGTELVFDLVARPPHESPTHAEQLGERALVEVLDQERPEHRLDVVLHEVFHYFFAAAKYEALSRLAKSFTSSKHPLAYPAWNLLNESLATAFGNAMVMRLLDPTRFRELEKKPLGFYADEFIDAVARQLIEPLSAALASDVSVFDAGFFQTYMSAVERAYPKGMPPRMFARTFACAYETELEAAYQEFDRIVASPQSASTNPLEAEGLAILGARPLWTHVLMARSSRILSDKPWGGAELRPKDRQEIERRAKTNETFVYYAEREGGGRTFVFSAPDDARMQELVQRFGKLETLSTGVLTR